MSRYYLKTVRSELCSGHARRYCLIIQATGMQDNVIDRYQGVHHRQMFERALTSICLFHKVSLLVYAVGPTIGACVWYIPALYVHLMCICTIHYILYNILIYSCKNKSGSIHK